MHVSTATAASSMSGWTNKSSSATKNAAVAAAAAAASVQVTPISVSAARTSQDGKLGFEAALAALGNKCCQAKD
jgi:hypothetical protein